MDFLARPWPWYVAGPLIGLTVPTLLLLGGREFGVSAVFRHMCAAALPGKAPFFCYDWRKTGLWNLAFVLGLVLGGVICSNEKGLAPFDFASLATVRGFVCVVVGSFLVGFGARWAGGCTSGHAITGLAAFELPSLIAVMGFFAGGLLSTHLLLGLFS